ncbi:hypothetical protein GINT2_002353 [Glugoides intestinalis]
MRYSANQRKVLENNKTKKEMLIKALALYNIGLGLLYWYKNGSKLCFILFSTIEIIATLFIFKITKPCIIKENGIEKLNSVTSVNSPGMLSFLWDLIFWAVLGKFLLFFSLKWIVVYLGIPLSFFSEFFYKPYQKLKTG